MNLKEMLKNYRQELNDFYDDEEIQAMFYMVSEHLLGLKKSLFIFRLNEEISASHEDVNESIIQRLKKQEPIQYILEEAYFYGLKFKVNPAVLIPRPETEELVEMVIHAILDKKYLDVLDIGTGSGCIAIALKKNIKTASVSALDISEQALDIATYNAETYQTAINFIHADIRTYQSSQTFDVIVSNPPYITAQEKRSMDVNVTVHEPHLALFVSDHRPLEFYEAIADFANMSLNSSGMLFFEINANFGRETAEMLSKKSFTDVMILKDMQGKNRFITAVKQG